MKKPIVLVGGGGHCRSVIEVIESAQEYEIVGIVDKKEKIGEKVLNYPILWDEDQLTSLAKQYQNFVITVGQIKTSKVREQFFKKVKDAGGRLPVIIAPTAYVSNHCTISEGTVVMHHALINANAKIGKNCIINSKSLIEHDVTIGDHCHVSTNATVNGGVKITDSVFIGSGSVINQEVSIGENSIIASGSVVIGDVKQDQVYAGNPAKFIKSLA